MKSPSEEGYDRARVLKGDVHHNIQMPCWIGDWNIVPVFPRRKKAKFQNRFRLILKANTYSRPGKPKEYTYYFDGHDLEAVRRAIDNAEKHLALQSEAFYLINMYRTFVPKRTAARWVNAWRRHVENFDIYTNKESQRIAKEKLWKYLRQGNHREEIDGIHAANGDVFDDRGISGKVGWLAKAEGR